MALPDHLGKYSDEELVAKLGSFQQQYPGEEMLRKTLEAFYKGEIHKRQVARRRLGLPPGFEDLNDS